MGSFGASGLAGPVQPFGTPLQTSICATRRDLVCRLIDDSACLSYLFLWYWLKGSNLACVSHDSVAPRRGGGQAIRRVSARETLLLARCNKLEARFLPVSGCQYSTGMLTRTSGIA